VPNVGGAERLGGERVTDERGETTFRGRRESDAQADERSSTEALAGLRTFVARAAPSVFARLGACHAVDLREVSIDGRPAGALVESCDVPIPASLSRAVPSRIRSYLAGRHCAARALAVAGAPTTRAPLAIGSWGAPEWPAGYVGSITHSARLAAAVALPERDAGGVGIDCEVIMSAASAADVAARVLPDPREAGVLREDAPGFSREEALTVVFSAKESVYKCLYPLAGIFFDFDAVRLERIDPGAGTIRFRVVHSLAPGFTPGVLLEADYRVEQEHVFTAVRIAPFSRSA
jgi:enterobactin synthetase component D